MNDEQGWLNIYFHKSFVKNYLEENFLNFFLYLAELWLCYMGGSMLMWRHEEGK